MNSISTCSTVIIPDINLLLYTYNTDAPAHTKAITWWQELLSGDEPVGLPLVVIFGFVRLATLNRVFPNPMMPAEAAEHVRRWLDQPQVRVLIPTPEHVHQVCELTKQIGTAGNLVTDAQIAAIALDHDATVHSADADFTRFPGLRWYNPITGAKGTNPR